MLNTVHKILDRRERLHATVYKDPIGEVNGSPSPFSDYPPNHSLVITEEEVLEAVEAIVKEEGLVPNTVTLLDAVTGEDIEIEVADYLDIATLSLLEVKAIEL